MAGRAFPGQDQSELPPPLAPGDRSSTCPASKSPRGRCESSKSPVRDRGSIRRSRMWRPTVSKTSSSSDQLRRCFTVTALASWTSTCQPLARLSRFPCIRRASKKPLVQEYADFNRDFLAETLTLPTGTRTTTCDRRRRTSKRSTRNRDSSCFCRWPSAMRAHARDPSRQADGATLEHCYWTPRLPSSIIGRPPSCVAAGRRSARTV